MSVDATPRPGSRPPRPGSRAPRAVSTARGRRAQDAIADAVLALFRDGVVRPTAPQVAARAGVALRTVWHHFPDLDALYGAAAARRAESVTALMTALPTGGPLEARLAAFVRQRAAVLEAIAPVRRAALLVAPWSPAVATAIDAVRARKRAQVREVFARELAAAPPARVAAACALASYATWSALRDEQRLAPPRAKAALAEALRLVLTGDPR